MYSVFALPQDTREEIFSRMSVRDIFFERTTDLVRNYQGMYYMRLVIHALKREWVYASISTNLYIEDDKMLYEAIDSIKKTFLLNLADCSIIIPHSRVYR